MKVNFRDLGECRDWDILGKSSSLSAIFFLVDYCLLRHRDSDALVM